MCEFFLQVLVKHGPSHLAPEPPHLAHAHGAQDLEKLIVPPRKQVADALRPPHGIHRFELHGTGDAACAALAHAAFHGNEERYVAGYRICPADDELGHMLRHGYAPAAEKGNEVAYAFLHKVQVDLPHPVLD